MLPAFWKEPFLDLANTVWAMPEEFWIDDSPRLADTELLEKEAAGESTIDDTNLRAEMVKQWKEGSDVNLRVKELPGRTRLIFLGTDLQWSQIPWSMWSRIFQAIGHPIGHVLFYAHPLMREFPNPIEKIQAKNINAGYSFICQQHTVVIYRFEEATRVLLHELLHTACFDKGLPVELLEANTEAWTEVFLRALLSRGLKKRFVGLWKKQCAWMKAQTEHLQEKWKISSPQDYAWRYTIGRHQVLLDKGYIVPSNALTIPVGLRFTTPEWDSALY